MAKDPQHRQKSKGKKGKKFLEPFFDFWKERGKQADTAEKERNRKAKELDPEEWAGSAAYQKQKREERRQGILPAVPAPSNTGAVMGKSRPYPQTEVDGVTTSGPFFTTTPTTEEDPPAEEATPTPARTQPGHPLGDLAGSFVPQRPEEKKGFLSDIIKKIKGKGDLSRIERGKIAKQLAGIKGGSLMETGPGIKTFFKSGTLGMLADTMRARDIGLGEAAEEEGKLDLKKVKQLSKDWDKAKSRELKEAKYGLEVEKFKERNQLPITTRVYEMIAQTHEEKYTAADRFMEFMGEELDKLGKLDPGETWTQETMEHAAASAALRKMGYEGTIPFPRGGAERGGRASRPGHTPEQIQAAAEKSQGNFFN